MDSLPRTQKNAFIIAGFFRTKIQKCFFLIFDTIRLYIVIIAAIEIINSIVDKSFAGFADSLVFFIVYCQALIRELYFYKCSDAFLEVLTKIFEVSYISQPF